MIERKTLTGDEMAAMSAWDIASALGCEYSGDRNALVHGGYFYDPRDWLEGGYASVVDVWGDPEDENIVYVDTGVIHRLEGEELKGAFRCVGMDDLNDMNSVLCQIEACRNYDGFECGEENHLAFNLAAQDESEVWERIRPLIESLGK